MSKNKHRNRNYNGQKRTTGKDLQIQTTTIELKGRKYEMNFDLNAMAELEDIFGTLQIAIAELKKKKLKAVRSFLYAVLKSTDESLTEFEVGKLIDMNNFTTIEKAITKLINANGEIRIIRNGMISQVSNFSRSFSVAAINVDILYNENIDNVIELLNEKLPLLKENYNQIIEGPIVAGVDELKNNAVSIRITAKTEAEEHYAVRRALLKYTKEIFEENNIKIPTNKIIIREEKENE